MFPVYRKYANNRSFFKIISNTVFIQINCLGDYYSKTKYRAKTYPDKLLIHDMIELSNHHWETSSEEEFEKKMKEYKNSDKQF